MRQILAVAVAGLALAGCSSVCDDALDACDQCPETSTVATTPSKSDCKDIINAYKKVPAGDLSCETYKNTYIDPYCK